MMKTISIAAIVAMTASASFAGSLNTQELVPVQPVFDDVVVAPAGSSSSIGTPAIIAGVLALTAVAVYLANDDDDDNRPAD